MQLNLVELCRQATVVVEETLRLKRPTSCRPGPGLALAAVPTPELATGDERHELGSAGVELVRGLLGGAALYSVSHTRAVSIVLGALGERFGVDLERLTPARPKIALRILTACEREMLGVSPEWLDVLRCFCMKEATYKILGDADQETLGFRSLQLEDARGSHTRVCHTEDGRCLAVGASGIGSETLIAIARPLA